MHIFALLLSVFCWLISPEYITSERSERLTFLEEWSEDLELTEENSARSRESASHLSFLLLLLLGNNVSGGETCVSRC